MPSKTGVLFLWIRNLAYDNYRSRMKGDELRSFMAASGQPRSFDLALRCQW